MTRRPPPPSVSVTLRSVASAAALVVLSRPDWLPVYVVSGALLNGLLSKAIKKIVRQPRPAGSRRPGNGMPSSHAQTLFFLSTTLALLAADRRTVPALVPLVSFGYSVIAVAHRVSDRLHTVAQTIVGAVLGTLVAAALHRWEPGFVRSSPTPPSLRIRLAFVAVCAGVLFRKEASALLRRNRVRD